MALIDQLKNHPFIQGMSEPMIRKLALFAREVRFEPDQVVFRAGDDEYEFCLIVSGTFCVELGTPVYAVLIQTLGPEEVFGWSALLDHRYSFFQVRALEGSEALRIDGAKLREACLTDAKLGAEIYRRIAEVAARRIQAVELRLAEFFGAKSRLEARQQDPSASSSAA
jgi:CRP-like cAMP-binding protein